MSGRDIFLVWTSRSEDGIFHKIYIDVFLSSKHTRTYKYIIGTIAATCRRNLGVPIRSWQEGVMLSWLLKNFEELVHWLGIHPCGAGSGVNQKVGWTGLPPTPKKIWPGSSQWWWEWNQGFTSPVEAGPKTKTWSCPAHDVVGRSSRDYPHGDEWGRESL